MYAIALVAGSPGRASNTGAARSDGWTAVKFHRKRQGTFVSGDEISQTQAANIETALEWWRRRRVFRAGNGRPAEGGPIFFHFLGEGFIMSAGGVSSSSYVIPPELRGGDIPNTVVRGDTRPPEIIFQTGFEPRDTGPVNRTTLLDYATNNTPGPYVSTSRSESVAEVFAGPEGYVYRMATPTDRAIDVNHALGDDSPYPGEQEIAVAGGIAGRNIREALNLETGEIIKNPNFVDAAAPPPPPNSNAPGPRHGHDELKRRRLEGSKQKDPPEDSSGGNKTDPPPGNNG